ncbi:MAG: L-aspartate oxidase [Proteobacteria bacterium]|nr:L-aspartate oxidase [Pseudomonadota bacterium]
MNHGSEQVVVVGAGLGGLMTALELAPQPVLLLSRSPLGREVATAWAQGGIAAALDPDDSPALHAADTLEAGAGTCDSAVVDAVTREAPETVARLERYGVAFDRGPDGRLALGREGGHGRRRIAHARDATGDAITRALIEAARRTASITILEGVDVRELVLDDDRVAGLAAVRGSERLLISARAVVLATGGAGGLYAHTSNPLGARGEGFVMAARAGAVLADLEFVQFHPTAIDVAADPMPLATEALRGEGALLVNSLGERFMAGLHPLAELAPRDIVSRAIFRERAAGRRCFLDARQALGAGFAARFPTVHASCMAAGIDPARDLIPVAPAAHYHMGGIAVDARSRSSLPGLWAVGEVAATGLHGANRLASNSLLEAAVFGARAAHDIAGLEAPARHARLPGGLARGAPAGPDWSALARVRSVMDTKVGVVREAAALAEAIVELAAVRSQQPAGALSDAATAGFLIACAALARRESRGGHFRADHPVADPALARRSTLTLSAAEAFARGLPALSPPVARVAAG